MPFFPQKIRSSDSYVLLIVADIYTSFESGMHSNALEHVYLKILLSIVKGQSFVIKYTFDDLTPNNKFFK